MFRIKTIILMNWVKNLEANALLSLSGVLRRFSGTQTLKCSTNFEMAFTVPGLNQREHNYIERQVNEVMATNTVITGQNNEKYPKMNNDVLRRRVIGLMETYEVKSEHRGQFLRFVNNPPRYINGQCKLSRYVVDHQLVKLRLLYSSLSGGDERQFLLVPKPGDELCSQIVNQTTFQLNYRSRYLDCLSHLGLEELEGLIESLDGTVDFQVFSQTFFEQLLWIKSGVTNVDAIRKKITKATGQQTRTVRGRYLLSPLDPINIVRNYFIFDKILAMDLDIDVKNMSLLGTLCSLDVLVTLNVWDRVMWQHLGAQTRRQNIAEYLQDFGGEMIQEDVTFWYFPSALKQQYLIEIGFNESEVDEILLMSSRDMMSQIFSMTPEPFLPSQQDSDNFLATMKKRLNILRTDGPKLGVLSIRQMYQLLFHWDQFIKAVDKSNKQKTPLQMGHHSVIQSVYAPIERMKGGQVDSNASEMLTYYFECETFEERSELARDIQKLPHHHLVPIRILVETIKFLENEGFSKVQMREAVQLLFYSHKILGDTLGEIRLTNQIQDSDWLKEDNALCKLHYFVEKRSGFTFKEVLVGVCEGAVVELSEELIGEINNDSGDVMN